MSSGNPALRTSHMWLLRADSLGRLSCKKQVVSPYARATDVTASGDHGPLRAERDGGLETPSNVPPLWMKQQIIKLRIDLRPAGRRMPCCGSSGGSAFCADESLPAGIALTCTRRNSSLNKQCDQISLFHQEEETSDRLGSLG